MMSSYIYEFLGGTVKIYKDSVLTLLHNVIKIYEKPGKYRWCIDGVVYTRKHEEF